MNMTVTLCHKDTQNLPEIVRRADVVVAAVGHPHLVKADWIKPGAAIIDVGINDIPHPTSTEGKMKIVGDVDFNAAKDIAGVITPVPGGVGPVTVSMLMENTIIAAMRKHSLDASYEIV